MKSDTYKEKAKELREKRKSLKDCPRNAKRIAELKAKEQKYRAKAKEKKSEEENKLSKSSQSNSSTKKVTSFKTTVTRKVRANNNSNDSHDMNGKKYRGWSISQESSLLKATKGFSDFLHSFSWELLKNQIDELEDKREALASQVGRYRGWKIINWGDRFLAQKKGCKDISVYLGGNIRDEIDKYENAEEIVYEETYHGRKIIKKRGSDSYIGDDHIHGDSLTWVKKEIDKEIEEEKREKKIFAHPESFSESYKGWKIKIQGNHLIAEKGGKTLTAYGSLKERGLELSLHNLHNSIDNYEIHKNDPVDEEKNDDDTEYINIFKDGLETW